MTRKTNAPVGPRSVARNIVISISSITQARLLSTKRLAVPFFVKGG